MKKIVLVKYILSFALIVTSVAIKAQQNNLAYAVAWKQSSAEHVALYHQGFNIAKLQVEQAINDGNKQQKPLAIISDVDETLLLADSYWAYMIANGRDFFDDAVWDLWVKEDLFSASPGSLEFAEFCRINNIEMFYVTNRDQGEKTFEIAKQNLETAGFHDVDAEHLFVLRETSNKDIIQQGIMNDFQVVTVLGDNLNDFSRDYYLTDVEQRKSLAEKRSHLFGIEHIVFPNPTDGHWMRAIFGTSEPTATPPNRELLHEAASRDAWSMDE